jgi:hypothetical protein
MQGSVRERRRMVAPETSPPRVPPPPFDEESLCEGPGNFMLYQDMNVTFHNQSIKLLNDLNR